MESDGKQSLKDFAESHGMSMTETARRAIEEYIKRRQNGLE